MARITARVCVHMPFPAIIRICKYGMARGSSKLMPRIWRERSYVRFCPVFVGARNNSLIDRILYLLSGKEIYIIVSKKGFLSLYKLPQKSMKIVSCDFFIVVESK